MREALAALVHLLGIKPFERRVEHEIFERIFAHHRGEKDFGYDFRDRNEMQEHTAQFAVQEQLETIEQHIWNMPAAYGEAFRYILHRDLRKQLMKFEALAQRRVQSKEIDPRFVAARAI